MGEIFFATCECGYRSERLKLGGGMRYNPEGGFRIVSCPKCRKIFSERYTQDSCIACGGPIREISIYGKMEKVTHKDPNKYTEEEDKKFFDALHRYEENKCKNMQKPRECPRCGKMTLLFVPIGLWD